MSFNSRLGDKMRMTTTSTKQQYMLKFHFPCRLYFFIINFFSLWLVVCSILQMSFSSIIKEHKAASMHRHRELEKSKLNVMSSLEDLSSTMLHSVEKSTRQVQIAQQKVDNEARNLQAQTASFAKYV